ncbi:hypothetical protein BU073_08685 [Mammaliicoccus vitulinus]|nr:hypothetical protein BU073_08685 [Mammaliicoccus vitulinus]
MLQILKFLCGHILNYKFF